MVTDMEREREREVVIVIIQKTGQKEGRGGQALLLLIQSICSSGFVFIW